MNRLFASALGAAVALSAGAAQALPFAGDRTQHSLVVPAAGGCGIGRARGPDGVCHRKYYLIRRGPHEFYSTCGGRGAHRVCNLIGQCWMVCD